MAQMSQSLVGKERIVRFLNSETGKRLNNKRCTVLSSNPNGRLAVRMLDDHTEHAIKPVNLVRLSLLRIPCILL